MARVHYSIINGKTFCARVSMQHYYYHCYTHQNRCKEKEIGMKDIGPVASWTMSS